MMQVFVKLPLTVAATALFASTVEIVGGIDSLNLKLRASSTTPEEIHARVEEATPELKYELDSVSHYEGNRRYDTLKFKDVTNPEQEHSLIRSFTDGLTFLLVTEDLYNYELNMQTGRVEYVLYRKKGDVICFTGMRFRAYGKDYHREVVVDSKKQNQWMVNGTIYGDIGAAGSDYVFYAVVKKKDELVDTGFKKALNKSYNSFARDPIAFYDLMKNTVELKSDQIKRLLGKLPLNKYVRLTDIYDYNQPIAPTKDIDTIFADDNTIA